MIRSTTSGLPSVFTLFHRLLALPEQLAGLSRSPSRAGDRPTKLHLETMEERLVPDGRPLPFPVIFAGAGIGEAPVVKAYDAGTGNLRFATPVYEQSFLGGVRVATADFTRDGIPDVVVAPGPGHAPLVKILDGTNGHVIDAPLGQFHADAAHWLSGVFVAAGDVDGDQMPDVITAINTLNGPRVRAFSGATGAILSDWCISGQTFGSGMTIAAVDVTGDGKVEGIFGGLGGWVTTRDMLTGVPIDGPLGHFRAFGSNYFGGVFVSADSLAGDVNADGVMDVVVGTMWGEPRVKVFSGANGELLADLRPFGPNATGGARVALAYVDDDPYADIVVGSGPGTTATIRVFSGLTGEQLAAPLGEYQPFGNSQGGVFVAASNDPSFVAVEWTSTPTSSVEGQFVRGVVTVTGEGATPTGTVTFKATVGFITYTLDVVTLTEVQSGTAQAVLDFAALRSGTYSLEAVYSGDSNYFGASSTPLGNFTVSAPASGVPINLAPGDCFVTALTANPAGAGVQTRGGYSVAGVNYSTGSVVVQRSDLNSGGYGNAWGLNWSWTSSSGYADGISGTGATSSQTPHLVQANGNDSIAMVANGTTAYFFDLINSVYRTRFYATSSLYHDTGNGVFVVTDGTGQTFTFYDFSGGTPSGREGKLKKVTDAEGNITEVTSWAAGGKPEEVQRVSGSGGSALTESFLYTYIASGTNAGLLETVTQRTKIGTGSWSTVRSTAYTYYDGMTGPGLAGALKLAVVKDSSGNTIGTNYYRYYTSGTGSSGNMKYVFGRDAYARLTTALGTSLDSLTDGQVDDYVDKYMEYDSSGRVTKVIDAAAGCSVCAGGQGEFDYSYTTNSSAGLLLPNEWAMKTVETLPDGSTNTIYTNAFGQVMLDVFEDYTTSDEWMYYYRYDDAGRTILEASPSAVTGYSEMNLDLVGYSAGNASYLDDDDGLVTVYTYATSTTATTSTVGDAAGFLKSVAIKHGETGTAIPQSVLSYILNTVSSTDFVHLASQTVYRNDNGTGGQTTEYDYAFFSGTNQIESTVVTLPTVTTAQNGSNAATTITVFYDEFGRPVWSKDQAGFISYVAYDTFTGAVVKTITDVDTTETGDFANLPSGWSTPSGGGLHLISTFTVDALGRVTKSVSPEGRIDYTVYDDDAHEVRYYSGWNTTSHAPTGPTTVVRVDQGNGYTESLTMSATPNLNGSDEPTGTESITKLQSLSRSYVNAAGQVTHTDEYFNLSGLTYSTSTSLGTEGTHFYRTEYQYDDQGRLNKTVSPEGTIYRTVYDSQGRVVSEWVGTDDTPTTGNWSPTNLTGTNTVKVREYEYDGGDVGDGNLTKITEYPGTGADRVTQMWYDWRNRTVAVKQGVEGSESTAVNRPLAYYDYDNLGQVTKTRVYDADNVTPTITDDVPQPLSASLLRAQTSMYFDELGRVYLTEMHSVDPSDGTVDGDTLDTNTWFDARGLVIKSSAPGGLVQKITYDGAGRATVTYLTDGGGDSGYSDADDVTSDIVLEQSETTYSDDGTVLQTLTRQRFHDASGTGSLGSPSSGIGARVSYAGYYYDASSGRLTASVDVGTNGGSAWSRPGSAPSSSSTVHVTSYNYAADAVQTVSLTGSPSGGTFTLSFGGYTTGNIAYDASAATVETALEGLTSIGSGNVVVSAAVGGGWEVRFAGSLAGKYQSAITGDGTNLTGGTTPAVAVATVSYGGDTGRVAATTDPAGREHRSYFDALGRTVRSIENFVDGVVSDGDDKTVAYAFNGAGLTSLTAYLTGGGVQTTRYVFGVTQGSGSEIDSNDIVGLTQWPDASTGAASASEEEETTVNALGATLTFTDRNGSVHTLTYDVLGRVTSDAVTTLGSGVDGAVRRIETAYDSQGNAYLITSYDAASSGNIVNQVQREFNGLGQLTKEWQAHSGAVNTSTSPKVQYAYSEMPSGANHSRLTSITYPSGYVLTFNYSSGLNSDVSRLSSLSDTSGTLESYSYLGMGTVVVRSHPQPDLDLTYIGTPGDGGDQYAGLDRFGRVIDHKWEVDSTAVSQFEYGYDLLGNRLWRDDLVNTDFGELYSYDNFSQLTGFERGELNGTHTAITGAASRSQEWDFDALGNWESITNDGGSAEERTHNAQNEITSIDGATTPTYDANGNMTGDETGRTFVYDAWNRLVAVKSGETTLKSYTYDGLNRRVSETASGVTTDLYYSDQWQVLEERVDGDTYARYVWSPVYVDAMVLRDRDSDDNGSLDERLWVIQDANFNVVALIDTSGAVVERYAYDPFGVATVMNASWSSIGSSAHGWAHLHQGLRYDPTAGLNFTHTRPYSPSLGRFTGPDWIGFGGGDVNLYRMEGNNSVNGLDPSGLKLLISDNEKAAIETIFGAENVRFTPLRGGGFRAEFPDGDRRDAGFDHMEAFVKRTNGDAAYGKALYFALGNITKEVSLTDFNAQWADRNKKPDVKMTPEQYRVEMLKKQRGLPSRLDSPQPSPPPPDFYVIAGTANARGIGSGGAIIVDKYGNVYHTAIVQISTPGFGVSVGVGWFDDRPASESELKDWISGTANEVGASLGPYPVGGFRGKTSSGKGYSGIMITTPGIYCNEENTHPFRP